MSLPLLCLLLLLPRIYVRLLQHTPPTWLLSALLLVVILLMALGLIYVGMDRPTAGGRNRDQADFLRGCLLPLGIAVLLISLGWAWLHDAPEAYLRRLGDWRLMVGSATVVYFGAWCTHLWQLRGTLRKLIRDKLWQGVAGERRRRGCPGVGLDATVRCWRRHATGLGHLHLFCGTDLVVFLYAGGNDLHRPFEPRHL